ncbi:MAG: flagellar protein FlgN [Lachnospiraceae bacterium]|nr:flagellar protein FlgN [Lachnospiraceae bacterium]
MDDLIEVLNEEKADYEKLVALGEEKRQAVISAEIDNLERISEEEQVVAGYLQNRANKRVSIMSDMAQVLGKDPAELTVSKLIAYMENQPDEQRKLADVREGILSVGKRLKSVNELNETLIEQAMEMVEFDLTLFRSMRQAPETANYDKNAYNTGDILGGSGFDAKQ